MPKVFRTHISLDDLKRVLSLIELMHLKANLIPKMILTGIEPYLSVSTRLTPRYIREEVLTGRVLLVSCVRYNVFNY